MAKAPLPTEESIQNLSIDEHESVIDEDESEMDEEPPRIRTLESIASNLSNDFSTMPEDASALEKSQFNAILRDSSIGLILKHNHSKALLLLESMKPLQGDRIEVLFLMGECELRLKQKEPKYVHELANELLQTESVDCEDLLEWGKNLAFPMNGLVGWIHVYDIARRKMAIKYDNQDKYAAWIVSPAHEIGLNGYNVLKCVKPYDTMLIAAISATMEAWDTSLRDVGNQKLKHMSEIQCRVSSDFCFSTVFKVIGGGRINDHYRDLQSKYDDLSSHKVYSFVLMAMAMFRVFEGRSVRNFETCIKYCDEGLKACEDAQDFISPEERKCTILIFKNLRKLATKM